MSPSGLRTWRGCAFPDDLLYDVEADVWVRLQDGEAVVGMTDPAQTRCGRLVGVTWKRVGTMVRRHRPLAVVESAKWVGPMPSPLSGTILATNQAAFDADMAVANRDPYGAGWFCRLAPEALAAEQIQLLPADDAYEHYRRLIDEQQLTCMRCAE